MTLEELEERCRNMPGESHLSIIGGAINSAVILCSGYDIADVRKPGETLTEAVERLLTLAEEKG